MMNQIFTLEMVEHNQTSKEMVVFGVPDSSKLVICDFQGLGDVGHF